ncbi:MAG: MBL fold metallo-hydrolase [Actinomycetota bacterium]|nr:MBL fold metallo-hydrolase [Actinomycetota bacterium]
MRHELRTLGHATLLLLEDGIPVVATDPWVIGSAYWRSWWLEKYPTDEEIDLVRNSRCLYVTHSHPDHFHWPSLRHIGTRPIALAKFPRHSMPDFLGSHGYEVTILDPWRWHGVTDEVRIASIPVPIDDSILVVDTPNTTIVNVNDANPRQAILACIRDRLCARAKPIVLLKSYSPASLSVSMFIDGQRVVMKTKSDYAGVTQRMARALDASHFVPFASQAFFNRTDSRWANEYRTTYEDLREHWGADDVTLCQPFVSMNLEDLQFTSSYSQVKRDLDQERLTKVVMREEEEASFELPQDFESKLKAYLDKVYLLRLFFRRGIGWRLTTSGKECFYDSRTRQIVDEIPPTYDFIVSLPDKVLYEALGNNILTDLGITMFTRVDTQTNVKLTYGAFSLMALHDYGYFTNLRSLLAFLRFYLPYLVPLLLPARWTNPNDSSLPSPALAES